MGQNPCPWTRHSGVLLLPACLGGWSGPEPSLLSPLLQLSLHGGHFSEGQLPPPPSLGKPRDCSRVLGSSSPKLREWRERVRPSGCLGNSVLREAAWVEPQHLFRSHEILDKSPNVLAPHSFLLFEMG